MTKKRKSKKSRSRGPNAAPRPKAHEGAVDYRAVLRRLIRIWETERVREQVTIPGGREPAVAVAVRGLTAHTLECAKGVLALYQASIPIAAAPLIRVMLEDAVTAGWILVVPDAWKSTISNGLAERRKALRGIEDVMPDEKESSERLAELSEMLDRVGPSHGWPFNQRAAALEGTDQIYVVYRYLTGLSHAGTEVMDAYSAEDTTSPFGVAFRDHAHYPLASLALSAAASCALQALIAWDCALATRRHENEINEIAANLGIRNSWVAHTKPEASNVSE